MDMRFRIMLASHFRSHRAFISIRIHLLPKKEDEKALVSRAPNISSKFVVYIYPSKCPNDTAYQCSAIKRRGLPVVDELNALSESNFNSV